MYRHLFGWASTGILECFATYFQPMGETNSCRNCGIRSKNFSIGRENQSTQIETLSRLTVLFKYCPLQELLAKFMLSAFQLRMTWRGQCAGNKIIQLRHAGTQTWEPKKKLLLHGSRKKAFIRHLQLRCVKRQPSWTLSKRWTAKKLWIGSVYWYLCPGLYKSLVSLDPDSRSTASETIKKEIKSKARDGTKIKLRNVFSEAKNRLYEPSKDQSP